jgi:hypothetical protein
MAVASYQNFDLTITARDGGVYRAEAKTPEGGEPFVDFALSFTEGELAWLREVLGGQGRDAQRNPRAALRASAEVRNNVKRMGERLYDAVLTGDVLAGFTSSLHRARDQGAGLRIRLRFDQVPDLAQLPWEYLYRRSDQQHLALSEKTPIVRYFALPDPGPALLVEPPLNLLVMIANPGGDYADLNVDEEWARIQAALGELVEASQVSVNRVPGGTWDACQECLAEKSYHIFHFIGHGDLDPAAGDAAVVFEGENGRAECISGESLRVLLDHSDLRLVILNSCHGAEVGPEGDEPFAGVALKLVQANIPAVIAMQSRIADDSAILFARRFYGSLAKGLLVDNCLADARKAMWRHNPTDWGTPVLFLRPAEGRIFQVVGEEARRQDRIRELAEETQVLVQQERWGKAIERLQAILELEEGGPI